MRIKVYTAVTANFDHIDDVLNRTIYNKYAQFRQPRLNAKIYKVLPHLFMNCEYSIWTDGNVQLNCNPEDLVALMEGKDIMVFKNPNGDCLYEEANRCKDSGLDVTSVIEKQVARYKEEGWPKNNGLGACRLIVRRHTSKMNNLNALWWSEICAGSFRDEISFPFVYGDSVKYINHPDSYDNKFFTVSPHKITLINKIRFKLTGKFH
jgi:hypothetical protein